MNNIKITRKELYDLVWSEPMISIAKKYKISDNGLRKICIRLEIPTPSFGYWVKKKFGKPVTVTPFNANFQGSNTVFLTAIDINDEVILKDTSLKIRQKEIELDKGIRLKIPEKLFNPDLLIRKFKENLILRKRKDHDYYSGYDDHLNINVDGEQLNRAILIMDTFIKAIKYRGYNIKNTHWETILNINGEEFKIHIREKKKRIELLNQKSSWNKYEYILTGILVFKIERFHPKEWSDVRKPLEDQLSNIIAWLELESDRIKIEREEFRLRQEEYERQKQKDLEIKQRKLKELNDFKELLNDAQRWKHLSILREYIDYVENKTMLSSQKKQDWVKWARDKADWYDPSVNLYDELMDDIDKNTLKQSVQ